VILFAPVKKKTAFPAPILRNSQMLNSIMLKSLIPNFLISVSVESTDRNEFTSPRKAWLSLPRYLQKSDVLDFFSWTSLQPNFIPMGQMIRKYEQFFLYALKQRVALREPTCMTLAVSSGSAWRSVPNFVQVRIEIQGG
jgi:hypothetical protein